MSTAETVNACHRWHRVAGAAGHCFYCGVWVEGIVAHHPDDAHPEVMVPCCPDCHRGQHPKARSERAYTRPATAHAASGAYLRSLRVAAGMTQGEVGMRLGLTSAAVSEWERGKNAPHASHLARLVHALPGFTLDGWASITLLPLGA